MTGKEAATARNLVHFQALLSKTGSKFSEYSSFHTIRLRAQWQAKMDTVYSEICIMAVTCIRYANIHKFRIYVSFINLCCDGPRKSATLQKYNHHYKNIPKITFLLSISCPVSDFDESVMHRHRSV